MGVPKLLCATFEISCSAIPTDGANCGLLNFRVSESSGHSPIGCNLQNRHEDGGDDPSPLQWRS